VVAQPFEIIVVVDGENQDTARIAGEYNAKLLYLRLCGGPAKARNIGARMATGEILLFVDADVVIEPQTVLQISQHFKENPQVTAIFGSYDDEPEAGNFLSQYKNLLHHFIHQAAKEEASTFWSGCGAIRRTTFLALGGFDEKYRQPAIEDVELGYRLRRAGEKIRLHKQMQCKHLKEWRALSLLKSDFFYRALPWTQLILREGKLLNDLNLRVSERLSLLAAYGILLSMLAIIVKPLAAAAAGCFILCLLALNFALYRFFYHKRGLWFLIQAIFWHWLYYLYGGIAFVIGTLLYSFGKQKASETNLSAATEKV
jgi:GT2 family glycosyltransferase